jgi:hypothetical protein
VTGVLGGGGGSGRWSSRRSVSVCDGVGPSRFSHRSSVQTRTWSPQNIVRNDGRIASLSHCTRGRYKNLPLPPPHYQKNRRLYRGACFRKFSKLLGTKVQNVRTGVLGFLTPLGKGVNTRTDNLRVHMADSDTRTTSVETTARSGWLEWRSHRCPKVTGTTSIF